MTIPTSISTSTDSPSTGLPPICDLSQAELAQWCESRGEGAYRAVQVRRWLFGKRVTDFEAMHDVPARLRGELAAHFELFTTKVVAHRVAHDRTEKLLLELKDGQVVECVLMRETGRRTVCISTQVGCAMGCVFCASGMLGLKRNLSMGEILEQVLRLDRLLGQDVVRHVKRSGQGGSLPHASQKHQAPNTKHQTPDTTHHSRVTTHHRQAGSLPYDERITNVVVMGIGEPLANLKALLPALDSLNEKGGLGLGSRRITISTVGLPEKIRELAGHGKPFNLAVSLHAPNDELRNKLVPVNARIGIEAILQAADDYFDKTGRRVTYEYVLLGGVNDLPEHADQLAALLKHRNAHVNLIPMNAVAELPFHAPESPRTDRFVHLLEQAGVTTTVRKRKGADIDAACGQLRLEHVQSIS